jgi:hypothetical protein
MFQEYAEGMAALKIVDQILEGDPGPTKARRAMHDLRVDSNHGV